MGGEREKILNQIDQTLQKRGVDIARDKISGPTRILKDVNSLTPDLHRNSDFGVLYNAIERRMMGTLPKRLHPPMTSSPHMEA
jgi:hypothetical protein